MTQNLVWAFSYRDGRGHKLQVYKTLDVFRRPRFGVEVYLEDSGLTTYATAGDLWVAWDRAEQIRRQHRKPMERMP